MNALAKTDQPVGVIAQMAAMYGMVPETFERTLLATVMGGKEVRKEEVAAFLLVAKEHGLNPFTKEIFAFPSRGGIQAVVSVDGWLKLMNAHPQFDGLTFDDVFEDKKLVSVTAKVYRKDRSHPIEVTEYMAECVRDTDVWKRWPMRMLRHKSAIQAARYAFGFAGIMEPDEYERMQEATSVRITPAGATWDTMDEETQARLQDTYTVASERYGLSGPIGVLDYMDEVGLAGDERVALLTRFPTTERREINYAWKARSKQKVLPAPAAPEPPSGDILGEA